MEEKEVAEEGFEREMMIGLEGLGDLVLHAILTKLNPEDVGAVACVSRTLYESVSEDTIWVQFCSQELDISAPEDPSGNPRISFKEAYYIWRKEFNMYPWPLVKRVKKCWGSLKSWMMVNYPEAVDTLQSGALEDRINAAEESLGVKLPLSTRILYRLCDGQGLFDSSGSKFGSGLGLIGGYSFYDHMVNVHWLGLSNVISATKAVVRRLGFSSWSKYIVVAASSTHSEKLFFLNCTDKQLYVGTRNLASDRDLIRCVPATLLTTVQDDNCCQPDGLLLWLEEHNRRLCSGSTHLCEEGGIRSINLFPKDPPLCSTAVTHGVQIRASAVFVPELSDLQDATEKYWFSYSIRMRLLDEGCKLDGMSFNSCQLYWRHWIIRANDVVVSDVDGEAVIGKYPILKQDGKEFAYESCTPLPASTGSIEGSFVFVPGRLSNPTSDQFDVKVARFPLQLPDYIF